MPSYIFIFFSLKSNGRKYAFLSLESSRPELQLLPGNTHLLFLSFLALLSTQTVAPITIYLYLFFPTKNLGKSRSIIVHFFLSQVICKNSDICQLIFNMIIKFGQVHNIMFPPFTYPHYHTFAPLQSKYET